MEAHNGLSAKIVEEAGFKGIWASGLSISAALGVRDNNEASWTQVLEVLEFMGDVTSIPILLDGDTGYGDFNTVRRLVKKLEQRNIAGVCLEDKLFPKTNSFINGERQKLAPIEEFCGKIKAAKDSQKDPDFVVVARVEAFIAGWGLREALKRAKAYRRAGADAILIHSHQSTPADIVAFMQEWKNRHPVVIVPTKYYSTPTEKFRKLGIRVVIWANQSIRAAARAMEETVRTIREKETLIDIEDRIAPMKEIFRLQGAKELQEAEKKYLPTKGKTVNAIILAASQGERFGKLTRNIPKALLKVGGQSILSLQINNFNESGIKDITVLRGFAKEKIRESNIKTVDNDRYATTTELYSFYLARKALKGETVISYGDIVYKRYLLNELMADRGDIILMVDADAARGRGASGVYRDFVKTNIPYSRKLLTETAQLKKISSVLPSREINGEFIGLWKVNGKGSAQVKTTLEKLSRRPDWKRLKMADLFSEILKRHPITVRFIRGSWLDIDEIADLHRAHEF